MISCLSAPLTCSPFSFRIKGCIGATGHNADAELCYKRDPILPHSMDMESFHHEQMKRDRALITTEIQKAVTELSKPFAQDPFCYSTDRSATHISFAVSGLFDKPSDDFMQETVTRFERLYPDITNISQMDDESYGSLYV